MIILGEKVFWYMLRFGVETLTCFGDCYELASWFNNHIL